MQNYLILYTPGMCGTWLTWLINQHKNFPQYKLKNIKYINDKEEANLLDVRCFGADWYIYKHMSKDSIYYRPEVCGLAEGTWIEKILRANGQDVNLLTWSFETNRSIRPKGEYFNNFFTKDCVKILPNHGCGKESWENGEFIDEVDKELLKNIVDEMQPAKIIVPVFNSSNNNIMQDIILKRWIIWKSEIDVTNEQCDIVYWRNRWNKWSDWVLQDNPHGNNAHYVDIGKIISGDEDEYLKLCEAINETPINEIQKEITLYRRGISEVAAHYDRITL